MWKKKKKTIEGKLQGNERGFAFLIPSGGGEDYFIAHEDLNGAMHGDLVLAEEVRGRGGHRTLARVVQIKERGYRKLIGTFHSAKSGGFVVTDDRRYFNDVFIPRAAAKTAKTGDKVECEITRYTKGNPEGKIVEVIGRQFDRDTEIACLIRSYGLETAFPPAVKKNAKAVAKPVSARDCAGREDFRNWMTFTIDGDDSKDFDDAVSIEATENSWILGVHIADVAAYVRPGSALDEEAYRRGTSVYFPEAVLPMLPEELSNDVCSLRPGEDRLTLSCVMEFDRAANRRKFRIAEGVIRSHARLTYRQVQAILDGGRKVREQFADVLPALTEMEKLASALIRMREERGTVDLAIKEAHIAVHGEEVEISEYPRLFSHRLIEEFMIAANECVAEFGEKKKLPLLYRIHERPAPDKAEGFRAYLDALGIRARFDAETVSPKHFQRILKSLEGTREFDLVNRVMLRSMQKARYSGEDEGHFGLASEHYCHFTSPIRRYPDLVVHRAVKEWLRGGRKLAALKALIPEEAKHTSERERIAVEAERAVDDYYKLLYMEGKIGESFAGTISGVTNFGVFVELDNTVEGLIRVDSLPKGRYELDETRYTLTGGGNTYRLGEPIEITVAGVDRAARRVEFVLKEEKHVRKDHRGKQGRKARILH